jgi:hypothetical protein
VRHAVEHVDPYRRQALRCVRAVQARGLAIRCASRPTTP